jgi:tetratricopeptide (TPR) repeat protein
MARLTQELDLDEETAAKIFPLMNRHEERVTALGDERARTLHELAQAVHEGRKDGLPALLDKLLDLEHQIHDADEATHKRVREVLTPEQAVKFFLFHEHFQEEVLGLLQDAHSKDGVAQKVERLCRDVEAKKDGPPEHVMPALAELHRISRDLARASSQPELVLEIDRRLRAFHDGGLAFPDTVAALEIDGQDMNHALGAHHLDEAALIVERINTTVEKDLQGFGVPAQPHVDRWRHQMQGMEKRAMAEIDKALAVDPTQASLWVARARVRVLLGDLDGARADATRARELDPTNAGAKAILESMGIR